MTVIQFIHGNTFFCIKILFFSIAIFLFGNVPYICGNYLVFTKLLLTIKCGLKRNILLIIGIVVVWPICLYSQEQDSGARERQDNEKESYTFSDSVSLTLAERENFIKEKIPLKEKFRPNSTKAVIYSAIFPGGGQIYNRKYWKLPLVYGGFLGCAYAISWNNTQYTGYRNAYRDFTDDDESTNSWLAYKYYSYSNNPNEWTAQQKSGFANALKNKKDYFRRYRDLSCIIAVGMYALCIIDAYVDAQLFEFDVSEDLSIKINPIIFEKTVNNAESFGLQCSITF
jgi:hypothetical protein